jgi:RimJ/RimL family protein N-acetyltransferase
MELDLGPFLIRGWRRGDEQALVRSANNPNVVRNLRDRFPHPYTRADADAWLAHAATKNPIVDFAIVVNGEAVGGIGYLPQHDVARRSVEIGYWLGEPYWGRGIVTGAVRALCEHIFRNPDICRIYASVFESNPASARVLEKAGFVCEGRLRKSVTKNGQTMDALIYALVKDE